MEHDKRESTKHHAANCVECGVKVTELTGIYGVRSVSLQFEKAGRETVEHVAPVLLRSKTVTVGKNYIPAGVTVSAPRRAFWNTQRGYFCIDCTLKAGESFKVKERVVIEGQYVETGELLERPAPAFKHVDVARPKVAEVKLYPKPKVKRVKGQRKPTTVTGWEDAPVYYDMPCDTCKARKRTHQTCSNCGRYVCAKCRVSYGEDTRCHDCAHSPVVEPIYLTGSAQMGVESLVSDTAVWTSKRPYRHGLIHGIRHRKPGRK